jgi:hypothetical protein
VALGCSLHSGRDGYADTRPAAVLVDEFKTSLLKKKNLGPFCQNDVCVGLYPYFSYFFDMLHTSKKGHPSGERGRRLKVTIASALAVHRRFEHHEFRYPRAT